MKLKSMLLFPLLALTLLGCDLFAPAPAEDKSPPAVVSDQEAISIDGGVVLTWTDPSDSDLSMISISYTGITSGSTDVVKGVETAEFTGLSNGESYTFSLISVDGSGNKSAAVTVNAAPNPDSAAPAPITSLEALPGDGEIVLSWSDPSDSDLNRIVVTYNSTTVYVGSGVETLTVDGLTNETDYIFTLIAEDFSGNESSERTITQAPETPPVVNGIDTATGYAESYAITGDEMTLNFDSVSWNVVNVSTASALSSALGSASAGDKIVIAPGSYGGNFELNNGGTQNAPIWIVGSDSSDQPVLDGGDYNNGTVLSIDGGSGDISYICVQNITATNGRTGISADKADYLTIDGVEVYNVGQAGIHVRDGSEYNIIKDSYVHDTGLYNVKYGEGIYIGSDYTKWPGTGGSEYDPACDYLQVLNNTIGPNVTAEHIDYKEGASYAFIVGNTFDASGMVDMLNGGLSFIDFKGNYAECAYNSGEQNGNELFDNAFEINEKSTGWGYNNNIHHNSVTFEESYYGSGSFTRDLTVKTSSGDDSGSYTKTILRSQWVVKCNVEDSTKSNRVADNTRTPENSDRMYNSSSRLTIE